MEITAEIIADIKMNIEDEGMRTFIHIKTGEVLAVPDEYSLIYDENKELWQDVLAKWKNNKDDYYEIERWTTAYDFKLMQRFAEYLTEDKDLQEQVFEALNRRKPFHNFKWIIGNSPFREKWFDFREQMYQAWIEKQLAYFKSYLDKNEHNAK
ncbi:MAG: hypothetical protein JJT94_06595 [Bernardetiaceae bacterium]|nr:hypothetical protein [Bernardetiaceae bacterium]